MTGEILIVIGLLVIFTGIGLKICLKKIPAKPPHVGLITIWGKRIKRIKKEGLRFFLPFFPFFYSFIPIKIEKVNEDFPFENIRCRRREDEEDETTKTKGEIPRSGGEISVKIGLTWQPDYRHVNGERLISFIDSGSEEGIRSILRDLIEEDVRQMGRERSWEAVSFATDELVARLVKKLTGEIPKQGQTTGDLQKQLQSNGFPDIVDLGIIIWRFNVGRVKEEGKLAEVAEAQAKEIQERRAEVYEIDTEIQQAQKLFKAYEEAGSPKTLEECILEIRRRKVIREGHGATYDIPGLDRIGSGLEKIGAGLIKGGGQ